MFSNLKSLLKYVFWGVIVPFSVFSLYTWAALTWVYSSGERAGYVQKLSAKGWICKTYEGELILVSMPGTQAEKFFFTVHDKNVAKKIDETVGKRVRLVYEEHKGIPSSCFGETGYFVKDIIVLDKLS
ncbi:MAG: hypothetical protein CVU27_07290 [Betaproteobacteria bacterium HGW-Betaproteobacteria-20]|nr:MAG: hypothetical protein CVU27_07290 [Betaproteobacteria bacterium HGW-Betaproteobacteria-20]